MPPDKCPSLKNVTSVKNMGRWASGKLKCISVSGKMLLRKKRNYSYTNVNCVLYQATDLKGVTGGLRMFIFHINE